MTTLTKLLIGFCLGIAILTVYLFSSQATGIWHVYHLATMPEDLFTPLFTDNFEFHTKGYSKEYDLNPKYRDIYEVSITAASNIIPSGWGESKQNNNELEGKVKIELFNNNTRLLEDTATKWRRATFQTGNMNFYRSFSLIDFPIPTKGFQIKPSKIKITVIEPYTFLEKYQDNIKLEVKVAATN